MEKNHAAFRMHLGRTGCGVAADSLDAAEEDTLPLPEKPPDPAVPMAPPRGGVPVFEDSRTADSGKRLRHKDPVGPQTTVGGGEPLILALPATIEKMAERAEIPSAGLPSPPPPSQGEPLPTVDDVLAAVQRPKGNAAGHNPESASIRSRAVLHPHWLTINKGQESKEVPTPTRNRFPNTPFPGIDVSTSGVHLARQRNELPGRF